MIRRFLTRADDVLGWLDSIEVFLFALIAGLLILVGPIVLFAHLMLAHNYFYASLIGLIWLGGFVAVRGDFQQRRVGWMSGILFGLWLIVTLLIGLVE
jgi:hypothetical protein